MSLSLNFVLSRFPLEMVQDLLQLNGIDYREVKPELEYRNLLELDFNEFDEFD